MCSDCSFWRVDNCQAESLQRSLGGGFNYLLFSSLPGEMIQFDKHIFQMGGKKPPTRSLPHPFKGTSMKNEVGSGGIDGPIT